MEEKRQLGEDIGEVPQIPHDVMERIGQHADASTQARLGVAIGRGGASLRLGARQRADKAATVLQSVVRGKSSLAVVRGYAVRGRYKSSTLNNWGVKIFET